MKYTLKLLWHGAILLGRVGWVLGGASLSFLILLLQGQEATDDEPTGMPERPNPADFSHPNWTYYYGPRR